MITKGQYLGIFQKPHWFWVKIFSNAFLDLTPTFVRRYHCDRARPQIKMSSHVMARWIKSTFLEFDQKREKQQFSITDDSPWGKETGF